MAPTFPTPALDPRVRDRRQHTVDVSSGQTMAAMLIFAWVVALVFSFARPPFGSSLVYGAKFAMAVVVLGWAVANAPHEAVAVRRARRLSPATLVFCCWLLVGTAG